MSIIPFSFELARDIYHATDQFPVDFEKAWVWMGYSKKDRALKILKKHFTQGEDFAFLQSGEWRRDGRSSDLYGLTVDCFKELAMMAGTEEGREVRRHFIQCEKQLKELLKQKHTQASEPPYWYRRLGLFRARTKIPVGYWCVFEEIAGMIADLEQLGYIPPEGIIPDISVGKCWCNYLRKVLGIQPEDIGRRYDHYYPDWAEPVNPYIYPLEYLPTFRMWFEETYKPKKMVTYFRRADAAALPSVCKLLGLPEGK